MDFNSKHKSSEIEEILDSVGGKQEKLVSGTNIKTINGESILGTGNITIKERELEKYDTDKSWSIVASSLLELEVEHGKAPDGTKAIVVAEANSLYGVNLFDALMGNVDGVIDVFTNPNAFTLEISAIDTSVELPVSITSDVRVEVPFNNTIYIDMGADMASIYEISVQAGYVESVWRDGYWHDSLRMIGNKMPLSRFDNLDDNAFAGLMAIAPALIVDFVGTKTITEYVKNGDNWEVWSEGESGLNTKLNEWLEQIAQLLPTKTSQLENDSNFITSDNLKTINGQSLLGSGDIEISGGGGSSSGSGAYAEVNHGTSDTTFTLTPNTFHIWDEVASLTLDFGSETSGVANEYLFQFTSGATATSLTLPDDIKWANDSAPTIAENMIYQVSILKGLASVLEFSNTQLILINFTIGGTQYQAEEGMSWNIWCNSQYNTDFVIDGGWIWKDSRYYISLNGMPETPSSIIIDGTSYELIDDWD